MDTAPLLGEQACLSRRRSEHDVQLHQYPCAQTAPYLVHRARRRGSPLSRLLLVCCVCVACLLFIYIPVYSGISSQLATIPGWSIEKSRNAKVYVQPENMTLIHDIKNLCTSNKEPLFLLIVVASSTTNFQARQTIRDTWGNYENYLKMERAYRKTKQKYINYNYDYDLINNTIGANVSKKVSKRSIVDILPHLATVLRKNKIDVKDTTEEERFPDSGEHKSEFDIDNILSNDAYESIDYEESNVMKIPPKGYENSPDLSKVLSMLKESDVFKKVNDNNEEGKAEPVFKIFFMLGMPSGENDTEVQNLIDEESIRYGDIVQEGFVDSYNNLTLKTIMMLKWIVSHCNEKVQYVLKSDDDLFVNIPRLVDTIREKSKKLRLEGETEEYYIAGSLIRNAKPVSDVRSKWYAPRYMYTGRLYPPYLSGTAYLITSKAVGALYDAALRTPLFYLEDVFITGICASRARPKLVPRSMDGFAYSAARTPCDAYARTTLHHAARNTALQAVALLADEMRADECERLALQKTRNEKLSKLTLENVKSKISKVSLFKHLGFPFV